MVTMVEPLVPKILKRFEGQLGPEFLPMVHVDLPHLDWSSLKAHTQRDSIWHGYPPSTSPHVGDNFSMASTNSLSISSVVETAQPDFRDTNCLATSQSPHSTAPLHSTASQINLNPIDRPKMSPTFASPSEPSPSSHSSHSEVTPDPVKTNFNFLIDS